VQIFWLQSGKYLIKLNGSTVKFSLHDSLIAMNNLSKEMLLRFESVHKEDIETITQVLARITTKSPDQIKPYLNAMLERLVQPQEERPLYETATPSELAQAFREWASSHDRNSPLLSDYAVSRESMYDNEEL